MDIQLKLNLQCLAKQSYAISLWERKDTRKKMKDYLYKSNQVKTESEWNVITRTVIKLLDPVILPLSLYNEMIYIIRAVGTKILDWFNYLKSMNLFGDMDRKRLYDVYFQDIYWTYYGTIDGLKILQSWMNKPNVDAVIIFNMACLYCLEDKIDELWNIVPCKLQKLFQRRRKEFFRNYGFYILYYWLAKNDNSSSKALEKFNRVITKELGEDGDIEEYLKSDQSPEANMFIFSASKGYAKAVEYFWENMTPEEQEKNLVTALSWALRIIGSRIWNVQYYRKEQFIEICIFLMKKLKENQLKEVIQYQFKDVQLVLFGIEVKIISQNIDNILNLFISIWPWQEFFMTAFNFVKFYLNKKSYKELLQKITVCINEDINFTYALNVYQRMFHSVWLEMPDKMKKVVEWTHMECLLDSWDTLSIKMILNDPCIDKIRADFLQKVFSSLNELLYNDQTDKVDQFIDQVLGGVDEKESKIPENRICKFIVKNQFDFLKNFQDLHSESEFKKIKSKINPESICHYLIVRDKFDLADKFLNWWFDAEEDVNHFKFEFRQKDFSRKHIFRIWIKSDQITAEETTERFLEWFLKTPEDLASFKLEGIILAHQDYDFDEENNNRFYKPFVEADRYEMVIALLEWCGIEEQYIKKFKKLLISNVPISRYMEKNQIGRAENFLKWASDTEEERTDLLRSFVNSKIGFLSCKKFVGSAFCDSTEDLAESFKKFINFWFVPSANIKKIHRKLISWKENLKRLDEDEDFEEGWDVWTTFKHRDGSDKSLRFEENEIYCSEENINLFLSFLEDFKNGDDQNEADDGDDDDDYDSDSSTVFFDDDEEEDDETDSEYDSEYDSEDEDDDEENEEDEAERMAIGFASRAFHAFSLRRSSNEESESEEENKSQENKNNGEEESEDELPEIEGVNHACRVG